MHRLSQGHRPQAAGHDRRAGVAVAMRPAAAAARRALLLSAVGALLGLAPLVASGLRAQSPPGEARPVDPGRFLAFAYSSAVLQERASTLAASKDTRPEVKAFAREMARFRGEQLGRLRRI